MIYDLSHPINEDLPVYPGDFTVKLEPVGGVKSSGFLDHVLTMDTHNGTHIDAPAHMVSSGKGLKDYSIERFITKGICLKAQGGFNAKKISESITKKGLAVLFYTGASDYFYQPKYWQEFPVMDSSCAHILIENNVSMVGVDAGSFDNQDGFPVHKALLGADILLIENLTNLKELVGKSFELFALPLKLEKDGAPARVIARLID